MPLIRSRNMVHCGAVETNIFTDWQSVDRYDYAKCTHVASVTHSLSIDHSRLVLSSQSVFWWSIQTHIDMIGSSFSSSPLSLSLFACPSHFYYTCRVPSIPSADPWYPPIHRPTAAGFFSKIVRKKSNLSFDAISILSLEIILMPLSLFYSLVYWD